MKSCYKKAMFVMFILSAPCVVAMENEFAQLANEALAAVTSNFNSFYVTVNNQVSDAAAFGKLGFPPTSAVNKAELDKYKGIVLRHKQAIKENKIDTEFWQDDAYLNRRVAYVKRAINASSGHSQGVAIALFCLKHYQAVMNSFDLLRLVAFVKSCKDVSEQQAHELASQLGHLTVSTDNALLRNVLENSGFNSNVEQPKIEQSGANISDQEKDNGADKNGKDQVNDVNNVDQGSKTQEKESDSNADKQKNDGDVDKKQ